MPYSRAMQLLTVIESPLFTKYWPDYWSNDEHGEFMAYIAGHPQAGDVVPGSGGCGRCDGARAARASGAGYG